MIRRPELPHQRLKRTVQIANPASFLAQKILIHEQRDYRDRAKDLLYTHDTIEVFSETLDELQKLFRGAVVPKLHPRRVADPLPVRRGRGQAVAGRREEDGRLAG